MEQASVDDSDEDVTLWTPAEDDYLRTVVFFHPVNRLVAESLLLQSGTPGAYLLRKSTADSNLCLSVHGPRAIHHYLVLRMVNGGFQLGDQDGPNTERFVDLQNFVEFVKSHPVLGCATGNTIETEFSIPLLYPYPRIVNDFSTYERIRTHQSVSLRDIPKDHPAPIQPTATREGYLTKLGQIRRNWRTRWFCLSQLTLSYHKHPGSPPIRVIDLRECKSVQLTQAFPAVQNCIALEHKDRTYYFYAAEREDAQAWLEAIKYCMSFVNRVPESGATGAATQNA